MRSKLLLGGVLVLLFLFLALLWQYADEGGKKVESRGELVVGFYMVANEKLEDDIAEDLEEIISGSTNFTGVVYIACELKGEVLLERVVRGEIERLSDGLPTLVSPQALYSFLSIIYERERISELVLVLGGENGGRNQLFSSAGRGLEPQELKEAFERVRASYPAFHISLLQVDMCNVANLEVLSAAGEYASYFIGSEVEISARGHDLCRELQILNDFEERREYCMERILDLFVMEHTALRVNSQFSLISLEEFSSVEEDLYSALERIEVEADYENATSLCTIDERLSYVDLFSLLEHFSDVVGEEVLRGWEGMIVKNVVMEKEEAGRLKGIGLFLDKGE